MAGVADRAGDGRGVMRWLIVLGVVMVLCVVFGVIVPALRAGRAPRDRMYW